MFSNAISNLAGGHHGPINEEAAIDAHQQVFGGGASNLAAGTIGTAAAMQALKSFLGSGGTLPFTRPPARRNCTMCVNRA